MLQVKAGHPSCKNLEITHAGTDRYISFCDPMFVLVDVLSQPNFKVK